VTAQSITRSKTVAQPSQTCEGDGIFDRQPLIDAEPLSSLRPFEGHHRIRLAEQNVVSLERQKLSRSGEA
jgi:hypothetical protein